MSYIPTPALYFLAILGLMLIAAYGLMTWLVIRLLKNAEPDPDETWSRERTNFQETKIRDFN